MKILAVASQNFGLDFKKLSSLGRLGMRYCSVKSHLTPKNLRREFDQFRGLCISAMWGRRAELFGVDFKPAFTASLDTSTNEDIHIKTLEQLIDKSLEEKSAECK